MFQYFLIKHRLLQRAIREFGVSPLLGYPVLTAIFVVCSILFFALIPYAVYFYVFFGLSFVFRLSTSARNDFLGSCFSKADYFKVRIIENLLAAGPFAAFLIFKLFIVPMAVLILISILLVFIKFNNVTSIVIPTPFYKRPFEFCVGFRQSFILLVVPYFLTVMAIVAPNFNLGLFALILLFLILLSYYQKRENEYYIWIFGASPGRFLFAKMKTAWFYSICMAAPIILALSTYAPHSIIWLLIILLAGQIYLGTTILAKYSLFSEDTGIRTFVVAFIIFLFPPFITIPVFYAQSKKELNKILK